MHPEKPVLTALVRNWLEWFARDPRDLPWRRTLDPYAIWISEIMLQQTQVKTVVPYWKRWMKALPTVEALAKAPGSRVLKLWEGLGYYTRARNLQAAAHAILNQQDGRFPTTFATILALPGIGRYTAGAICSIALDQPTPVVDGNVARILTRLLGITGDPKTAQIREQLWSVAEKLVLAAKQRRTPFLTANSGLRFSGNCSALNQALMEFGALVCTPRNPRCPDCPVRRHCIALHRGLVDRLPSNPQRPATTSHRLWAFVILNAGKVLVRQRPPGGVNANLWEFPNCDVQPSDADPRIAAREQLGLRLRVVQPIGSVQHSITRYRISIDVFAASPLIRGKRTPAGYQWVSRQKADRLPFTGSHRKILRDLMTSLLPVPDSAGRSSCPKRQRIRQP